MTTLALPAAAETAAYAASVGGELRVLVNRPRAGFTEQLRLRAGRLETLPPLPLVAAGAAGCGGELLVTGADGGMPLVLGVDADGRVSWRAPLSGPTPTRWPLPGCAPGPAVAWQLRREALEVADVGAEGISRARSLAVGGPPLDVSLGGGAAWAAWPDPGGVRLAVLRAEGAETHHLARERPFAVAVGALETGGAAVAWAARSGTFLAVIGPEGEIGAPARVDAGPAAGGRLAVVAGPEPLVWARRTSAREDEEPVAVSALVLPGRAPLLVHEPVFAVAWWGRRIAAVCADVIRIFDPEDP